MDAAQSKNSDRRLQVLFFTQKVDETDSVLGFVCDWIAALGRKVHQLHCVCLEVGQKPEFPGNVSIHSLGRERGHGRARLVWESQKLMRCLVARQSIDAVFAHMAPIFTVLCYPWTVRRSIPILTWYTHRQVTPTLRLAVALSSQVLTAARQSIRVESDKVLATGHGIAIPRVEDLRFRETDGKEVLAVGRLTPIKRWEVFIEAAALLKDKGYRFRMVGDATVEADLSYRQRLRDLVDSRGLGPAFCFQGAVPYREMVRYYRRAFCTVNTCVASSFDKAVLESMAFGKPALSSNPAFASLLTHETPPLLFPDGDAAELASRIEELGALSGEARERLGLRLRARVEQEHGLERLMDRVVELMNRPTRRSGASTIHAA